jgi:DNA polymerase I-like protein with 3'-5' exonuclease and polymerase domains
VLVDSGRTSARRPNVQQVSRDGGLRECYIARPGHVFIGADYDTLEMRSLAQVAYRMFGTSRMRDVLIEGRDLHLDFAAKLLGISYDEAVRRYAEGDQEVKAARQFAKVADFGFPGGLGAATFTEYAQGYGLDMTEAEARRLKDQFVVAWPEMGPYFRAAGDVTAADNPKRTWAIQGYGRARGNITYTRACNTPFQGLAADGAKEALWLVQKACWTPGDALCGSRIALFVHDEIIIETPESDLKRKGERLVECMVEGMQRWIPDVPITAEPVVMRRWSKDAHNNDNEVWDA